MGRVVRSQIVQSVMVLQWNLGAVYVVYAVHTWL